MQPSGIRRVALLIESSRSYGRGLLRGIAQYVRTHETWSLRHQELSMDANAPLWLRDWDGDGILARIESRKTADIIRTLGIPTVDLRSSHEFPGIPRVDTNDHEVVRLAVEHLHDCGFRRFAFCGFRGANYSVKRLALFQDCVRELGQHAEFYESPGLRRSTTTGAEVKGMLDESGVARWIQGLKKPVGLMACNDIRAQQVLEVCKRSEVAVPDEVAVVGVDNDDVICPLCDTP
jgi:LacI family transcriptional regulator